MRFHREWVKIRSVRRSLRVSYVNDKAYQAYHNALVPICSKTTKAAYDKISSGSYNYLLTVF